MPRQRPAATIASLAAACALLAGCTSGSGVNTQTLDSTITTSTSPVAMSSSLASPSQFSTSQSSSPASPSVASGTDNGLPAHEAADRAAVESQWIKSWDVLLGMGTTPAADREALAATVAIDPIKAKMLEAGIQFDSQGLQTYGTLGHRISWPQSISGAPTAVIDDCQDASQTGSMKTATGEKVTVGVPRDHYQGNLVKGDDGVWRVAEVYYLKDEPC